MLSLSARTPRPPPSVPVPGPEATVITDKISETSTLEGALGYLVSSSNDRFEQPNFCFSPADQVVDGYSSDGHALQIMVYAVNPVNQCASKESETPINSCVTWDRPDHAVKSGTGAAAQTHQH